MSRFRPVWIEVPLPKKEPTMGVALEVMEAAMMDRVEEIGLGRCLDRIYLAQES
jgi:hypothetical protein